ncbi:pyruvate kinase [Rubeoparvulum massiliense]|uniref:pyruvate kinase n=1 Tax=Rubeoparvulum massiliense TaxID=1631346 RepID=UPI00065E803C|nr:pyruvate kinase [Rubeoparvulum massiliense]
MRKTKIVCTIGPASEQVEKLVELIQAGMDVARLNFSHGTHEEHAQRIKNIRAAVGLTGKDIAILLDTKGPEIRTGKLREELIQLEAGEEIVLSTEEILGDATRLSISYTELPHDVQAGDRILLDDGLIGLEVLSTTDTEIRCRILNGGELKSKKGVNVPDVQIQLPGITQKDEEDIRFGIEHKVDFIAASFVRKASDVLEIRRILEEHGSTIQIIPKIENREGVENVDDILDVADGLMVARGDLGVEIPVEEVPIVQKELIKKCNLKGKPVITATQMLDSMQRNPRPTRAESSDVANAILDGTDAIMLSGETAAGKYPVESVKTMVRIAERTETAYLGKERHKQLSAVGPRSITDVISEAVSNAAFDLHAAAILAPTESGQTAKLISKHRPAAPIIAVTPYEEVRRKLALVWGVHAILVDMVGNTDTMLTQAVQAALATQLIQHGDLVVITAGVPVRQPGTTNLMKIHIVGDATAQGQGIGKEIVNAPAVLIRNGKEAMEKETAGKIVIVYSTDREMVPALEKAVAIVAEEGGLTSHAAIMGLHLGIPVVVGVKDAMDRFHDDQELTLDPRVGHIYAGQIKIL